MSEPEASPAVPTSSRRYPYSSLQSLLLLVTAAATLLGLGWATVQFLVTLGVRVHMEGVTRELSEWAVEHSQIHNNQEAFRAVDMLTYIEHYYVPSNSGYRSDDRTEAVLQAQRQRTTATIIEALKRFSGEQYGDDLKQWEIWRQKRQTQSSANSPQPQGG